MSDTSFVPSDNARGEMRPPSPSAQSVSGAPWIAVLAEVDQVELWPRAEALCRARARVRDLSYGVSRRAGELLGEIETAHAAVELAERRLARAPVPALAVATQRDLEQARAAEEAVLARAGLGSWMGFQLCRVDVLVDPAALQAVGLAEAELGRSAAAWRAVAGRIDPEAALAARTEIERLAGPQGVTDLPTDPGPSPEATVESQPSRRSSGPSPLGPAKSRPSRRSEAATA